MFPKISNIIQVEVTRMSIAIIKSCHSFVHIFDVSNRPIYSSQNVDKYTSQKKNQPLSPVFIFPRQEDLLQQLPKAETQMKTLFVNSITL